MTNLTPHPGFSVDWSYPCAVVWGLVVLVSLAGWGWAVGSWLIKPDSTQPSAGWALSASWGMATFLVVSGPLIYLSLFSKTFIGLFLFAGVVLWIWHVCSGWKKQSWSFPSTINLKASLLVLLLFIGLTYANAAATHWYNENDDFAAYFPFSKMLLDQGTISDSFNFRLLGSMEGQPALNTLVLGFLPWKYGHLLDMGIAGLIVLGLVREPIRLESNKAWTAVLILVALALTFPMPRINTASQLTGVVLFMALMLSFDYVVDQRSDGWKSAVLLGGVMTAAATLRAHNIFALAVVAGAFTSCRLWQDRRDWNKTIREAVMTVMTTAVFLAPWCMTIYRSSGAFLYPLCKGTQRPEFETFNLHLSPLAALQFVGGFFISTNYLLLFAPVFFLSAGPERNRLCALAGAFILISMAFLSQFTYGPYFDLYRYLVPIGSAFGLYAATIAARQLVVVSANDEKSTTWTRIKLAIISALLVLLFQSFGFAEKLSSSVARIPSAMGAQNQLMSIASIPVSTEEANRNYQEAFAQVPVGDKTLIALDYPFLLDYRRHPIFSIDVAGAASPEPGLPYFKGPQAVKDYLLKQDIHYIAYGPFDNQKYLHSRLLQNQELLGSIPMWRFYATFELDFFANIDELAKSNPILYDSPTIRVIVLRDKTDL